MKMTIKRRLILFVMMTVISVSLSFSSTIYVYAKNGDEIISNEIVARIGDVNYTSLDEAIIAAKTGQTIEIIKQGTYLLNSIPNNITIKGIGTGIVFDCEDSVNICSTPNGVTFENVEFNIGLSSYHGFQDASTINMNNCTLNGLLFSYWDMNFVDCTFNQNVVEYSMWLYRGDVSYKNCIFNGYGKFVNVYNEGAFQNKITVESCTANNLSASGNKAVFNIKETCGDLILNTTVELKGTNTYEGPAPISADDKTVYNSFLQVEDFAEEKTGVNGISVIVEEGTTINNEVIESGNIYDTNPTVDPIVYAIVEGKEKININREEDAIYKVDVESSKFCSVEIDGETIVKDADYKIGEDIAIITIYYSYLKDLKLGRHNLSIIFDDGYASTTFKIINESKPLPSPSFRREVPNTGVER